MSKPSNTGEDLVRGAGPDEGLGMFVVNIEVFADGGLQFSHAAEYAATNPFVGDFSEPTLHQVDPGTVSGREVDMEARSFRKPVSDEWRFVRAVVSKHDVDIEFGGTLASRVSRKRRNS